MNHGDCLISSPLPERVAAVQRLRQMKVDRVLQGVQGHLVNAANGVIICACGDCDQERNYTAYLADTVHGRMHRLQLNGGPLSISPSSPLHLDRDDCGAEVPVGVAMRTNIRGAVELKKIQSLVLVAHVPCGAADTAGMSVDEVLSALVAAKIELSERYAATLGVKVACFLHVEWTMLGIERRPSTYFVSRERTLRWLAAPPPVHVSHQSREFPTYVGS